ncbi:hypothetical protein F5H01DRAFT_360124 [Linnemannia elongata]|nr:hypothetical protein F5H01DRAFT_360124 [Linnemannia elongata]
MGILSLLLSLSLFFIFLCSYSYRLPFSCLLVAIVDMMSAAHVCLYLGLKFAFPFPLRFI